MNDEALVALDEASPLGYLARAESEAANPTHIDLSIASVVESIAVIGAGTMGSGIAICALDAGLQVTPVEQDAGALTAGRERILKHYARKLNADDAAERERRLVCTTDWQSLTHVDALIESVFEDLAVKQEVFQCIDKLARPGALLASNTSYLDLDGIAGATQRPRDVVGLHFFSPAHVMRLLEVVRGTESSSQSLATAFVLARRFGKLPVLTRNAFGFIGKGIVSRRLSFEEIRNRALLTMVNEAALLLEEGVAARGPAQCRADVADRASGTGLQDDRRLSPRQWPGHSQRVPSLRRTVSRTEAAIQWHGGHRRQQVQGCEQPRQKLHCG
jgi:hypothetical protein